VKYKVIIQKCVDPALAARIAEEVARWSGSTPDVVSSVITQKSICIRREADEDEAKRLRQQFEAVGAQVEFVALQPQAASSDSDEDDEPGRVLNDNELSSVLHGRNDIFVIEKEHRLRNLEIVSIILGIAVGVWLSTIQFVEVASDFFEKLPEERVAKLVKELPSTLEKKEEKKEEEKEEIKSETKKLKPTQSRGAGGQTGGGGDPRARVTQQGVLGIISGRIQGKSVASADIFGKGGFASDIDAVLSGVGGLKSGGDGGVGRKGAAGIGYGAGYGSGFGGGAGGVDDLIGNLMGGDGGGSALQLKQRGSLKLTEPSFASGGALTGGRSKSSIMKVVMQNLAALRYAYNKRLREKPGLKGKITVKFAIDEFGKVLVANVVESSIEDSELEATVVDKIKRWVFEKIDKPGDVTEVVYPFVFSQ
jgi:TonB family protein